VAADFEFDLAGFFVFLDACGCGGGWWLVLVGLWMTIVGVVVDVRNGESYRKRLSAGRSR